VIIGEAIAVAGVTCIFSALAYAELASTLPVSGSA
jgi:amino acid transporter